YNTESSANLSNSVLILLSFNSFTNSVQSSPGRNPAPTNSNFLYWQQCRWVVVVVVVQREETILRKEVRSVQGQRRRCSRWGQRSRHERRGLVGVVGREDSGCT
ncbi:hypothetical protein AGABI1DRAFT_110977, partial [Agaricus bisporus var. burnettii JB137-S8]